MGQVYYALKPIQQRLESIANDAGQTDDSEEVKRVIGLEGWKAMPQESLVVGRLGNAGVGIPVLKTGVQQRSNWQPTMRKVQKGTQIGT